MTKLKLIKLGLFKALLAVLYVSAVAWFMSNGEKLFGEDEGFSTGIAILLLFTISASVMGFLILGRPLMLYLDGLKKEALKLFYFTIAWLALIAALIFTSLAIF